ncbi:MAG: LON peptidase substrate-binding domain-containing protein [Vibrionaceae bacterium]
MTRNSYMQVTLPILFNNRHILPTGRLPITILPGVEMDTLTYALSNELPLGLCMRDVKSRARIGTIVEIEDFYTAEHDGLLTIQVSGKERFSIQSYQENEQRILISQAQILPSWPDQALQYDDEPLAERLRVMFERYPELSALHHRTHFDSLTWLCQRWLELLPLPTSEKQLLMSSNSCIETAHYLLSLMKESH